MTKYLVSFPGPAMDVPAEEMAAVGEAARAVIREAKDAGVYVFGGGTTEGVAPLGGNAEEVTARKVGEGHGMRSL